MEKVLMWRESGTEEWFEYVVDEKLDLDRFETDKTYLYEFKVIEKEGK